MNSELAKKPGLALNDPVLNDPAQVFSHSNLNKRKLADLLASQVVRLGGAIIILSILAILFVILLETVPLFLTPKADFKKEVKLATEQNVLLVGSDEYQQNAFLVKEDAEIDFISLVDGTTLQSKKLFELSRNLDTSQLGRIIASNAAGDTIISKTSNNELFVSEVLFESSYQGNQHKLIPTIKTFDPIRAGSEQDIVSPALAAIKNEDSLVITTASSSGDILVIRRTSTQTLMGESTLEEERLNFKIDDAKGITALALNESARFLFVGTQSGKILLYELASDKSTKLIDSQLVDPSSDSTQVTALKLLIGGRTLVSGDSMGNVRSWTLVKDHNGSSKLTALANFETHQHAIKFLSASRRNRAFASTDIRGNSKIHFSTSGQTQLRIESNSDSVSSVQFSPKADALLTVSSSQGSQQIKHWTIDNPHPEISLKTLFGKIWYEDYNQAEHVWQSSGGTDDFEEKLGLTPLIFGTLKGTFFAMLFAIPIAILAAIYTSQFAHRKLKALVKPTVELMAALPSVVIGFLAALWLAPRLEQVLLGVFLMPFVLILMVLLTQIAQRSVQTYLPAVSKSGRELIFIVPVIFIGIFLAFKFGRAVEILFFAGDFTDWLRSELGVIYDQRNSLVIGIAMGFAVIPIIFTISEDCLSNVPKHLTAASLALGASRWQTALKVVLPVATPGIFSAVMIGLGRAIGETMIVLMATGNTPLMDFSAFNGFRALSANIAVELPEAPHGGTLYRILFLAALVLFVMTFALNTISEVVRASLRKKYKQL